VPDYTLEAPMPTTLLAGGSFVRMEAIDPTTQAAVTGVVLTDVVLYGFDRSLEFGGELTFDIPALTPDEVIGP
jgi:hypothetical protein